MSAEPMWPDHQDEDPDHALAAINEATIEERRGRVLLMKLAGGTFTAIARDQKISITTARKDYQIALQAHMGETPDLVVARHRAVLIDVMRANYPKMMEGDKDAAAVILKALDREAKLLGLDAPTRVLAAVSDVEFAHEASRLISRIADVDPTALKELTRVGPTPQEPLDVETVPVDGAPGSQAAAGAAPRHGDRGDAPPAWPSDPVVWVDYVPEGQVQPDVDSAEPSGPGGHDPQGTGADPGGDTVELPGPAGDTGPSDYLDGWSNIE